MQLDIQVKGLRELIKALSKFKPALELLQNKFSAVADEEILEDRGGGKPAYPPETSANHPPVPYYIRGRGTQYLTHNAENSQQMHQQYNVQTRKWFTEIGNHATYAPYVIGDPPAKHMAALGWLSLFSIAKAKLPRITERWSQIVADMLKGIGIKVS